jgi:lipopolysaccharide assembly outer membrane protein LptD (OstA)
MKSQFWKFYALFLGFIVSTCGEVFAQKPLNPAKPTGASSIVEVLNADIQDGVNLKDMQTQTFTGNVIFRHEGVLMGTNKAIQNTTTNIMEAFGNIKINQGDTLTIVGDTLYYEGNTRIATIWGRSVVLRDKKVTLRTKKVIYNMASGMAYYPVPGEIMQDSSKLTSKTGYYNTNTKYFNYIGDVEVVNPQFVLCTDSMDYDTHSKKAIFKSLTTIRGESGDLTAERGWYNIQTKESYFSGRSKVDNEKYILIGDTLNYDSQKDFGWARGNVVFVSKTDSLITVGNEAIRVGSQGITKVNGETITKLISAKDTTYLAAEALRIIEKTDTLSLKGDSVPVLQDSLSVNLAVKPSDSLQVTKTGREGPSRENVQFVIATGGVKVFRPDMQSLSDSLIYNMLDSTIGYYQNPILWHKKNQIKADSIDVFMKNNRIYKMEMIRNCFIIEEDTLHNYNQIKGRHIEAYFTDSSQIDRINIFGNAESKFFVLDDNMKIVGLNTQQGSSMTFLFSGGELEFIKAYTDVDEETIPPSELTMSKARFEDFDYRIADKPSKESILQLKHGKLLSETNLEGTTE